MNKAITWNIAGGFCMYHLIIPYFTENKLWDTYKKIVVYDGLNHCAWNGGRVNNSATYSDDIRDHYYDLGWSINLTFTNPIINLADSLGNFLLHKMHRKGNGLF